MAAFSRNHLMVLTAAILFSTGGAVVKACSMTGWQVASLRSAVAVAAVLILIPGARRGWTRQTWLVGAAYAATMVLFVLANKLTTAAEAIYLQATAPLYVLLLSPWLVGERIRLRQLVFMSMLAIGMSFFFVGSRVVSATAPDPSTGNLVAAASGLTYGLLIIGLRRLGKDGGSVATTAAAVCCGNLVAAVTTAPLALPVVSTSTGDWAAIAFLGVFQIAVAYAFLVRGIARVPALEASLILIAEPVLSPFWAWLIHGEMPTVWAILGGIVILGVTAVMTLTKSSDP